MNQTGMARMAPGLGTRVVSARAAVPVIRAVDWRSMDSEGECFGWDALALHAAEPNPFMESWFLLPALRGLDPQGRVKLLRFEVGGRLAGIMPVRWAHSYYGYPFPCLTAWVHPNCFLGAPLVASGDELAFWQALFAWADANAGTALFLHFRDLPLAGPLYSALRQTLSDQKRQGALVHWQERAMLASPLGPAAYFEASLSGKKRKELRRQHNRLSELGALAVTRDLGADGLHGWTDEFLALERAGWKGQAGSALGSEPNNARFFREVLTGAAQSGRLERLTLRLDGRAVAMLVNFLTPPGAYSFKTTFDETLARYSPGVLLQRENLALLDNPMLAWTDSCAAADHPMIERIWRERREIGRFSIAIGGPLRRGLFRVLNNLEIRKLKDPTP